MVIWAGRVMVIQGVLHLVVTGLLSLGHVGGWLAGDAWLPPGGLSTMTPTVGAFWLTLGSFGVPQILLGIAVIELGRAGRPVPASVGWVLAVWGVVCAAVFEPSPFITALIPAGMLLVAARRRTGSSASSPHPLAESTPRTR
jgi:Family of unknown function (DUF6463)